MIIQLPWPPSVNNYWKKWNNRMVISKEGRLYRQAVLLSVITQDAAKRFTAPLKVVIGAARPDRRRRDLDNLLKSTLDSLTHAGVWEDDSQIIDLRIYWKGVGGFLTVEITNG